MKILGIDSAYCNTGLSIIGWDGETAELVAHTTIVTEPTTKKRHMLVVDDHLRRIREMYAALDRFLIAHMPNVVALEALSTSRNAGSAVRQGLAYATAIVCCGKLPLLQFAPQEVRKCLGLNRKSTKDEVAAAVAKLLPLCGYQPATEHEWDAAALALVARDTDIVRASLGRR